MLVKLKIKNFKSFKEETVFDFMTTTQCNNLKETNTANNVLKGAAFYGPNASGKSNVIAALRLLIMMMMSTEEVPLFEYHCLFNTEKQLVTNIEYEFIFDEDKITYKIELKKGEISKEELLVNEEEIIKRNDVNAEYKYKLNENMKIRNVEVNKNMLAARKIGFETGYTENPALVKWLNYIKNSIYIDQSRRTVDSQGDKNLIMNYLEQKGTKDINNFLELINYGQKIDYGKSYIGNYIKIEFTNKKEIFFTREDMKFALPAHLESQGNKTLINILPSILSTIENDGMLVIDEFDSSFHNELEELLLQYFMKKSNKSQLFFTAHSTNLLTSMLLRADQIYIIEYNSNKGSIRKRFSDENPRITQNWEKMYLSGVFDGLSNYNKDF